MCNKKTIKKTYFKDFLGSQNIQTGLHVDQGICKPDVVFIKLTLDWEIWEAVH